MFFTGSLKRGRTCPLYEKDVELPSDYAGVVLVARGAWKLPLAKELKGAGSPVDMNDGM